MAVKQYRSLVSLQTGQEEAMGVTEARDDLTEEGTVDD